MRLKRFNPSDKPSVYRFFYASDDDFDTLFHELDVK